MNPDERRELIYGDRRARSELLATIEGLRADVARLQEALLTRTVWLNIWHLEALRRVHPDDPVPRPTVEDYDEARRQLREAGLL
jgi:hypothetical protein